MPLLGTDKIITETHLMQVKPSHSSKRGRRQLQMALTLEVIMKLWSWSSILPPVGKTSGSHSIPHRLNYS